MASKTPGADQAYRRPNMPWWQGGRPVCSAGALETRSLSWGSVYWCDLPGFDVDASLQNDFGRLARCVHDSVEAFQREPGPEGLGAFLSEAAAAGINPVLCQAVRREEAVRTYHGRKVEVERTVLGPGPEKGPSRVRYRFGCAECLVASETTVRVEI